MTLTLVVLAAGMGSRFGGPKQLEPLGPSGETIMEYGVFDALRAGFDRIVVITRAELQSAMRDLLDSRVGPRAPIRYVLQRLDDLPDGFDVPAGREKPWGTGQAVLSIAGTVDGPFVVVNADDFYGARSYAIVADFLRTVDPGEPTYAAVGFPLGETLSDEGGVNRARLDTTADGWLTGVEELRGIECLAGEARYLDASGLTVPLSSDQLVSMNMWAFTPAVFGQLRRAFTSFLERQGGELKSEFLLPDLISELTGSGDARVKVLAGGGPWCGVTYPQDRALVAAKLARFVADGQYPTPLWR